MAKQGLAYSLSATQYDDALCCYDMPWHGSLQQMKNLAIVFASPTASQGDQLKVSCLVFADGMSAHAKVARAPASLKANVEPEVLPSDCRSSSWVVTIVNIVGMPKTSVMSSDGSS